MELETRTSEVSKVERVKSAARLRLRVADLLNAALEKTEVRRVDLAKRLGIDRASVTQTLGGNGNITVNTLADYLAAMGLEADIQVVEHGEILKSMREHRAPRVFELTVRDTHRKNLTPALSAHVSNSSSTKQVAGSLRVQISDSSWQASPATSRQAPPQNADLAFRLKKRAS